VLQTLPELTKNESGVLVLQLRRADTVKQQTYLFVWKTYGLSHPDLFLAWGAAQC
jgi:hypothetical protein